MEKLTCWLLLLLNLDFLQASKFTKVSRANFIPFGPENNDIQFPNQDDISIQFPIDIEFKFFDKKYDRLWINSNGIISFDGSVLNYTALAFPTKNFISVAPFWADVDITNGGNIFYRKIDDENSFKKINDEINAAFPDINFSCKWALHETWIDVPEYEPPEGTDHRNTFQAVIVTDFQYSFTIFNYEILNWSKGNAQAGFNSGDGVNYVILPGSFTNDIVNIAQNSNVGIAGKWIYRIEGSEIIDAECSDEKLEVSPGSVLFTGGEKVNISGICFKKDDNIQVLIDDYLVFKCEFKSKQLCAFTTTFLRKTGMLSLKISVNGKMVAQGEMVSQKLSWTQKIFGLDSYVFTNKTGDVRIEWPNDNAASHSVYLLEIFSNTSKWTLLINGITTNFAFIQTSLLFQDSSDDVRYCFLMIRNELDFEFKWKYGFQFFILNWKISSIDYQIQQWYSSQFDPKIFDQNLPYCWKAIPLDGSGRLPNLFHDFVIDEFCNPNNPSGCGLKFASYVCYNSVYFYRYENFSIRRQCCYGTNFILNSYAGGLLYMNTQFVWEHFIHDIRPFLLTCILSHNNQLYFEKRPIDSGNRWQPIFFGGYSSYFITYDKIGYTFNGFGEYDLMSITEEGFFVQIRMAPLLSQSINTITYMRAIAIKADSHADTIQFEMSKKNEIVMYLNGVLANLNEYESDRATEVNGAIVFISKNTISISYLLGVYLELRTNECSDSFSVFVSVSEKYAGKLTGLMGNMNTRQEDEFGLPNGTLLNLNSNNDKEIFSNFGQNWITTEESSIFSYNDQETHSSNQNLSFVPAFISEGFVFENKTLEQIAKSICQGNVQCLFQIYISNDPSRSELLLDLYEKTILFKDIIANQTNLLCQSIEVQNGGYNVSYHLDFGLSYFFYCYDGFSLDGDSRIKCSNLSQIPSCLMDSVETTNSSETHHSTWPTKPITSMNLMSQNFSHVVETIDSNFLNFDNLSSLNILDNNEFLKLKSNFQVPETNILITDWTSINSETIQNKKCVIPFIHKSEVYNFCGLVDNKTQCRTSKTKEEYDECSQGKFLIASSNESNGEAFSTKLDLNFKIKEKGKYSIIFHSSIVCEDVNCGEANDFIRIIHTKASSNGICKINVLQVSLANIGEKNKWKEKEAIVEEESNLLKLTLEFGRTKMFKKVAFLAVDNFQIKKLNETSNIPLILVSAGVPVIGVSSFIAILYFFKDKLKETKIVKSVIKKIYKIKGIFPDEIDLNNLNNLDNITNNLQEFIGREDFEDEFENEFEENSDQKNDVNNDINNQVNDEVSKKDNKLNEKKTVAKTNKMIMKNKNSNYFLNDVNLIKKQEYLEMNNNWEEYKEETDAVLQSNKFQQNFEMHRANGISMNDYLENMSKYRQSTNKLVNSNKRCIACDLRKYYENIICYEDFLRNRIFQQAMFCNDCELTKLHHVNEVEGYKAENFRKLNFQSSSRELTTRTRNKNVDNDKIVFF